VAAIAGDFGHFTGIFAGIAAMFFACGSGADASGVSAFFRFGHFGWNLMK
jgi:hypothetical protein